MAAMARCMSITFLKSLLNSKACSAAKSHTMDRVRCSMDCLTERGQRMGAGEGVEQPDTRESSTEGVQAAGSPTRHPPPSQRTRAQSKGTFQDGASSGARVCA